MQLQGVVSSELQVEVRTGHLRFEALSYPLIRIMIVERILYAFNALYAVRPGVEC
jgi:hypothetical protein